MEFELSGQHRQDETQSLVQTIRLPRSSHKTVPSEQVIWLRDMERPLLPQCGYKPISFHRGGGLEFQPLRQVVGLEFDRLLKNIESR